YICFHDDGGATFESGPNGERSVPVTMDERAAKAISALLALESLEGAYALARIYLARAAAREAGVRGSPGDRGSPLGGGAAFISTHRLRPRGRVGWSPAPEGVNGVIVA